jgi:hypothetical protein
MRPSVYRFYGSQHTKVKRIALAIAEATQHPTTCATRKTNSERQVTTYQGFVHSLTVSYHKSRDNLNAAVRQYSTMAFI